MAVNATAVWRVRPSGNNLNGGGYDAGISGAATDYSQQNAAQAIGTNGATSGAGSTTFTDATAAAFTSAMIGNCIQIASGTNFQAGFYFVTAFTNANSVVLDRTPSSGGAGSAGVWKLGGGWADFWTNTTSTGPLVAQNTVYILGSGTPNPAAYTYDYTDATAITPTARVLFANDPATAGYKAPPDTTGGMPVIKFNVAGTLLMAGLNDYQGLWFVGTATAAANYLFGNTGTGGGCLIGCVLDQFGFDLGMISAGAASGQMAAIGCEVFSSVAPGSAGTQSAFMSTSNNTVILITGCNVHDCVGVGITVSSGSMGAAVINSIIAKCQSDGIVLLGTQGTILQNCTIDGNLGNGIKFTGGRQEYASILNCIISNHIGAGKFGVSSDSTVRPEFFDYNVYYNNTADLNNLSYGPHDTHGGSNPYVGQATENFTLA